VNQPISQVELVPAAADPIGSPQIIDISKLTADAVVAAQEQVIGNIYQTLLPSVVQIRSSRNLGLPDGSNRLPDIPGFPFEPGPDLPDDFFERSAGTGFVWDDQGHIVTNHHVINGADRVIVIFADRSEFEAEVLGSDPDSDLAVLQINNPDGLPPAVTLGDSDGVRVGQMATAIGNPFGQEFTITSGIISAVGRTIRSGNSAFSIPEVLQTDASINPGNSGGPLLDRRGRVIGVNTQILSRSGSNSGIGFAVPINIAKKVIPALLAEGSFNYAWLGISGTSLTPDVAELMNLPRDTHGALIIELIEDGPAAQSDLRGSDDTERIEGVDIPVGGDVIVSIDGTPIDGIDDLIAYLVGKTRPDQEVIMEVIRGDGERLTIPITLGKRPGSL
jgi:2-alkenal reductase